MDADRSVAVKIPLSTSPDDFFLNGLGRLLATVLEWCAVHKKQIPPVRRWRSSGQALRSG